MGLYVRENGTLVLFDIRVVYLTDVLGVRKDNREMAKRLAKQGFVVALPNIFYRTDKLPIVGFE